MNHLMSNISTIDIGYQVDYSINYMFIFVLFTIIFLLVEKHTPLPGISKKISSESDALEMAILYEITSHTICIKLNFI